LHAREDATSRQMLWALFANVNRTRSDDRSRSSCHRAGAGLRVVAL